MTGPNDPDRPDDWRFPEVDPASTELPPDEDEEPLGAGPFDTGSDAWWRAQAAAQRTAAAHDPPVAPTPPPAATPVEPPRLVEPQVLRPEPPTAEPPARVAPPAAPPSVAPPAAPSSTSPLDEGWLPAHLAVPQVPRVPPPAPEPAPEPLAPAEPEPVPVPPTAVPPTAFPPVAPPFPSAADVEQLRGGQPPEVPRSRAVLGALLALGGVALGIGALYLLREDQPTDGPAVVVPTATASATGTPSTRPTSVPSALPTGAAAPTATVVPAPVVPVTVLNNSRVSELADRSADRFRAGGWPIAGKGNYRGGVISRTTVYYAPGQLASAQRFARQFGIGRVLPRFSDLPGRGMTVVLTRDYA